MLAVAAVIALTSGAPAQQSAPAYFVFSQLSPKNETRYFVFQLLDEARIAQARAILASPSDMRHVQGVIVQQKVAYNPRWAFHLKPDTIGFFEMQIEVCDANVTYVAEHLDEVGGAFLPHSFWCPWSSRLVREIRPPAARAKR